MQTSDERILTTHVGSLPRPPELLELFEKKKAGEFVDPDTLGHVIEDATRAVLRRQDAVGLDVANDGEQSRAGFHIYVVNRLNGFGGEAAVDQWADLADYPNYADRAFGDVDVGTMPAATERVEYDGDSQVREEVEGFHRLVEELDVEFEETFVTAASPGIVAMAFPGEGYDSHEEYVFDLAAALRKEYQAIAETGAVLQLDAPDLLAGWHRAFQDLSLSEYRERVRLHVAALNEALADVPREQTRMHVCWGNYEGPHHEDVPLSEVFPELYEADVGGLLIEQANPRHQHEYRVFEDHAPPEDWVLVPGVIDVKTNVIEPPEVVADRIETFADLVGDPTRVIAAPDCGFGTIAGLSTVDPEIAWAKLESLVEGAELASERLF